MKKDDKKPTTDAKAIDEISLDELQNALQSLKIGNAREFKLKGGGKFVIAHYSNTDWQNQ